MGTRVFPTQDCGPQIVRGGSKNLRQVHQIQEWNSTITANDCWLGFPCGMDRWDSSMDVIEDTQGVEPCASGGICCGA